ncbi:MAG: Nif3-like dinuclear metal center hexameric protein [Spirochaetaceae bacterium]|jgi:dinuclear metal center YbgI/SA1388 family protein|nr:Nif3-like dinuclear metal center hexameric protein [Spirochaetaceae bacterium]
MTTRTLDGFFRTLLDLEGFKSIDISSNGLQVDNDGADIGKIAFGVDASLETFRQAFSAGAGMLFVHHGLFWGGSQAVTGNFRGRLKFLLERNLALYAVHLPLDQHPQWGNSASLARRLGVRDPEPFGLYRGRKVGYKGTLAEPLTVSAAADRIAFMNRPLLGVYPFGVAENRTAAVISGGAANEVVQAIQEETDLYVTGEMAHQVYHECLEAGINMIAGGHYTTEVWGVRNIMDQCAEQLGIDVAFIDVPTGL